MLCLCENCTWFSITELGRKRKSRNLRKRTLFWTVLPEHIAQARWKNILCTSKHCCLCVKCCHLLGFIRRHSTSSRPHLTMPPRRKLSNFDRSRAVAWFQDGVTKREVARRLQVSISVIVRLIQRYTTTGRVQERRRSGRPKKTNPREDRLTERQTLQTRTASSSIIRRHVRWLLTSTSASRPYGNRLHGFNLRSRRPAVRPRLTPAHRAARRAFCRRHVRWTRHQWSPGPLQ